MIVSEHVAKVAWYRRALRIGLLGSIMSSWLSCASAGPSLYVSDSSRIKVFDAENGDYLGVFGETTGESLLGTAVHPVTGNLIAGHADGYLAEYHLKTGELIGKFGDAEGHVVTPADLLFHPVSGNLLVLEEGSSFPSEVLPVVQEYDATTGNFIRNFGATQGNLSAFGAQRLAFSTVNGSLLVSDRSDVREFHGTTGAYLGIFGATGIETGTVTDVAVHPGTGNVFVADRSNDDIREFDGTTGAYLTNHDAGGAFRNPIAIAFTPPQPSPPAGNGPPAPAGDGGSGEQLYFGLLLVLHDPTAGELVSVLDLLTGTIRFEIGENVITSANNMLYQFSAALGFALSNANNHQSGKAVDPVNTSTGELFDELVTDLSFGGPIPFTFSRYYASNLKTDGNIRSSLGDNWLHTYDFKLTKRGPEVTVINNRGRVIRFVQNGVSWELSGRADIAFQLAESGDEFILLDPRSGLMRRFNAKGKMTRVEDGNGNALRLTYSDDGRLIYISDGQGSDGRAREMLFTYSLDYLADGGPRKLIKVTDRGPNRSVTFSHTGNDLTSVADVRGNVTSYAYDPGSLKTGTTRPETNVPFTQVWNGNGQVGEQSNADGHKYKIAYNGSETTITDPLDNTVVHTHTNTGELTNRVDESGLAFQIGYDPTGRRVALTDRHGDTTGTTYKPESGDVESVTNADGTSYGFSYTPRVVSGVTHHDRTGVTHADGTAETLEYDPGGNLSSHTDEAGFEATATFDPKGLPLTRTNRAGGTTVNSFNDDTTLATTTDPANNLTTFGHDVQRRVNLVTFADGATRAFTYDLANHLLTSTDENNHTATRTYDKNGNLATYQTPLLETTTIAYDGNDRLLSITDPLNGVRSRTYTPQARVQTITDPNNHTTTLGYDPQMRLNSITDPLGHLWSTTHDEEGIVTSHTDPLFHTRRFIADKMGRITETTSPLGYASRAVYDAMGRVSHLTDELGATTVLSRDPRGLLSGVTLPGGAITTSYQRNQLGQLTTVTDPRGQDWERGYDASGRITSFTDPLGNTETIAYDNRNRPQTITFAGGLGTRINSYDPAGNLTQSAYSDGTTYDYTYDANDRLTAATGLSLGYDANGSITSSNGLAITRDPGRRITSITIAPGKSITYEHDANDRLTKVTDWIDGSTMFAYDGAGRLLTITRPNGVHASKGYDDDDRLTTMSEGVLSSISLARDGRGQITGSTRTAPVANSVSGLADMNTTFDAASQINGATHDAMGRLTSDTDRTLVWDLSSRLTSIATSGNGVSATYDALGQRLTRTESGVMRNYVWNYALGLPSIAIEKQDGADIRYYVHTPSGRLLYSIDPVTNARLFYHHDEMGNTLFLSNDAGAVTASYAYSPYGQLTAQTGASDNPFTWQGEHGVMAEGNDLYYIRARYFDSNTARFLSRDPVKGTTPRTTSPYQYALGNPVRYVDRTGLTAEALEDGSPEWIKSAHFEKTSSKPITEQIEKIDQEIQAAREDRAAGWIAWLLIKHFAKYGEDLGESNKDSDRIFLEMISQSRNVDRLIERREDLMEEYDAVHRPSGYFLVGAGTTAPVTQRTSTILQFGEQPWKPSISQEEYQATSGRPNYTTGPLAEDYSEDEALDLQQQMERHAALEQLRR